MKKLILGTVAVGVLAFASVSFADLSGLKIQKNGVEHTIANEGQVSTKVAVVNKEEAKKKMSHLKFNLPSYIPEGYSLLDQVAYQEPPEEFPNGVKVDVEAHKEVQFRIQDEKNPENFYDFSVKKANVKLIDKGAKNVEIEKGVKGEININNDNDTILLTWKENGVTYTILGHGDVTQEEALKIAASVN